MNNKIKYDKDFINKYKKLYPKERRKHKWLEEGRPVSGGVLFEDILYYRETSIPYEEIIKAFNTGKEQEIYQKALTIKNKEDLHLEWFKKYSFDVSDILFKRMKKI